MSAKDRFLDSFANADKLMNGQVIFKDHPVHGYPCLKLVEGRYAGSCIAYGQVSFGDDPDGGIKVSFNFEIVEGDQSLSEDHRFKDYIGELLTYIVICTYSSPIEIAESDWASYRLE